MNWNKQGRTIFLLLKDWNIQLKNNNRNLGFNKSRDPQILKKLWKTDIYVAGNTNAPERSLYTIFTKGKGAYIKKTTVGIASSAMS